MVNVQVIWACQWAGKTQAEGGGVRKVRSNNATRGVCRRGGGWAQGGKPIWW